MEKIAVGPEAAGVIDITASATENLQAVAKAKGESVRDVTAVILDRERHADLIAEVRAAGARIRLIPDGDVAGAISTAWPDSGADILFGIGGTPEGVIAAAALKCMGGEHPGPALAPQRRGARGARSPPGYDLEQVLTTDDLVAGDNCFFAATGITDGELLKGVHYDSRGATTQSLVMRSKSGTVRLVNARHRTPKLHGTPAIDLPFGPGEWFWGVGLGALGCARPGPGVGWRGGAGGRGGGGGGPNPRAPRGTRWSAARSERTSAVAGRAGRGLRGVAPPAEPGKGGPSPEGQATDPDDMRTSMVSPNAVIGGAVTDPVKPSTQNHERSPTSPRAAGFTPMRTVGTRTSSM